MLVYCIGVFLSGWFTLYNRQYVFNIVLCLVTQSCPTLCDPMDCSPPRSSVHGDSPDKNIWSELLCPPPQDLSNPWSNPGLLHCRWILHQLSYLGSLILTLLHNIHVYHLYEKTTINKQCYLKTMLIKFKYNYKSSYLCELYWHLNMILLK